MRTTGLERHYDKLTPNERVRLIIRAMARQDDDETARLLRAAPRKSYTMPDQEVSHRWRATERIAHVWAILWTRAHRSWLAASALRFADELPENIQREPDDVYAHRIAELAGVREGFVRVCARLDLDHNTVLAAWLGPFLGDELAEMKDVLDTFRDVATSPKAATCCLAGVELFEHTAEMTATTLGKYWPETNGMQGEDHQAR